MASDGPTPAEFLLGLRVVDCDDEDPDPAAIINMPCMPADEWAVDDEHTVASYPGNEPYPDDAPVDVVVFPDEIAEHGLAVDDPPLKLAELARLGVSYFAFPTPRLKIVGDGEGADIDHVPPEALNSSPYHDRTFDAAANAAFIADVRTAGTVRLLTARETSDGLELVDGHKRAWVVRQAGLDTVAVRVLGLDDAAAARAYARAHGLDLDDLSAVPEVATDRDRTARRRGPSLRSGQITAERPHPPPRSGRLRRSRRAFAMVRTGRGAGPARLAPVTRNEGIPRSSLALATRVPILRSLPSAARGGRLNRRA